jgi:hypothetical protein
MKKFIGILFVILTISACSSVSITKQADPTQQLPDVPTLVRGDLTWEQSLLVSQLSIKLGISVDDIMVAETTAVNWQDDCLGVKDINRACAQVDIPGFRFILVANGKQYEYHTSKDMTEILLVEDN